MSAFTEPSAEIGEALHGTLLAAPSLPLRRQVEDALAALDRIERLATEMETALDRIGWHELTWQESRDIARAVLSAREEGTA